jgi:hypothetical protein
VLTAGSYCHLKFPAIREETLSWDRPVLKDLSTGDIIDFYGPCDTDPLGEDRVQQQRLELEHRRDRNFGDWNDWKGVRERLPPPPKTVRWLK